VPLIIACIAAAVIDGDSIRCTNVGQVRVLGIDAPDRTDSRPCRGGFGDHRCDDSGAAAAKLAMQEGLRLGPVQLIPAGHDRYGRMLAQVRAGGTDLGCRQLQLGVARYIPRYDISL
jgi:micrococcal nuclease